MLHADGQVGTSSASIVATPRYVFIVPHSATIVPLVVDWFPQVKQVGPTETELRAALQGMLSHPQCDVTHVVHWLATHLPPEQVIDLPDLDDFKIGTGGMQRGFYYKIRGAWTWEGMDLDPAVAEQLKAYLPSPAEAKRAYPEIANRTVETRSTPGARRQGAVLLLAGIAFMGAGVMAGLLVEPVIIPTTIGGATLCGAGLGKLILGKPVDVQTGQPTGRWRSQYVISIVVGAFLGALLLWPAFALLARL